VTGERHRREACYRTLDAVGERFKAAIAVGFSVTPQLPISASPAGMINYESGTAPAIPATLGGVRAPLDHAA
jgi:hypothetical protein